MVAAHRRHDMTDDVWQRLRPHLPSGEGKRGRPAQDTGGSSTPSAGSCAPVLLGVICHRTMGTGRTPTAASAAGGTEASGPGCWKR